MNKYQEFKNKWLGKGIDFDGNYGNQCFDVYRQYCKELGFKQSPPSEGAKDIWENYLPEHFDKIINTTSGVPEQGDVIIWGVKIGKYGHVAIFDRGDDKAFVSIDQNWPTDGGKGVLHEVNHSYTGVLGWLRPKSIIEDMTEEQKRILAFLEEQKANEGKVREAFGALTDLPVKDKRIQTLQDRILDLESSQKNLEDRIKNLELTIETNLKLVTDWQKKAESANKALENANKTNIELVAEKNTWKNRYEEALKAQVNKYSGWELIKMGLSKLYVKK